MPILTTVTPMLPLNTLTIRLHTPSDLQRPISGVALMNETLL